MRQGLDLARAALAVFAAAVAAVAARAAEGVNASAALESAATSQYASVSYDQWDTAWTSTASAACPPAGGSASSLVTALTESDTLVVSNLSLAGAIPPDAVITGIRADFTVHVSQEWPSPFYETEVALFKTNYSTGKLPTPLGTPPPRWTAGQRVLSYPRAQDDALWGASWSPQDINSPRFGVLLRAKNTQGTDLTAFVSCMAVTVSYSVAAPGTTGGAASTTGADVSTTGADVSTTGAAVSTTGADVSTTGGAAVSVTTGAGAPSSSGSASSAAAALVEDSSSKMFLTILGIVLAAATCILFASAIVCTVSQYFRSKRGYAMQAAMLTRGRSTYRLSGGTDEDDVGRELDSDGNYDASDGGGIGGDSTVSTDVFINDIEFLREVGSGSFGSVWLSTWQGTTKVACKSVSGDASGQREFLREVGMLMSMNHPHVVRFLGVHIALRENTSFIVMEYCPKGSLDRFLRQAQEQQPPGGFDSDNQIRLCVSVAAGMAYLARKQVVHGDLSARNLLVSETDGDLCVKIADFGLSHRLEDGAQYKRIPETAAAGDARDGAAPDQAEAFAVAVRWAAPEVLNQRRFSTKSDVWAYGIVMWEIFSFAAKPYEFLRTNADVVDFVVEQRKRLSPPAVCPRDIGYLMGMCWDHDPAERPRFRTIHDRLARLLSLAEGTGQHGSAITGTHFANSISTPTTDDDDTSSSASEGMYQTEAGGPSAKCMPVSFYHCLSDVQPADDNDDYQTA
jgi:serine/threonine protein kinase